MDSKFPHVRQDVATELALFLRGLNLPAEQVLPRAEELFRIFNDAVERAIRITSAIACEKATEAHYRELAKHLSLHRQLLWGLWNDQITNTN